MVEVGRNQRELAWAYKQPAYQKFGRICLDHPIYTDKDAAAIAQELSLAGINELYITSQSSNQLDLWAVMDAFGLKLRGIGLQIISSMLSGGPAAISPRRLRPSGSASRRSSSER